MPLTDAHRAQIREAANKEEIINIIRDIGKNDVVELIAAKMGTNDIVELINDNMNSEQLKKLVDGSITREEVLSLVKNNGTMLSLINSHNPYTTNELDDMTIFAGNSDPNKTELNNINQVELEADGPYSMAMEWNFKGAPQKINKTIRIKYRYRAKELDTERKQHLKPPHWVTAYLLIGYEDGGA